MHPKLKTTFRWSAIILGSLTVLTVIFYAEENWRGQRAWKNYQRELEAKGWVLDWEKYIPPPVPDDQNFFKAPKMAQWFEKDAWKLFTNSQSNQPYVNELTQDLDVAQLQSQYAAATNSVLIAELKIEPAASAGATNLVLSFNDPTARECLKKMLRDVLGPSADSSQGLFLVAQPLGQIQPVPIVLASEKIPTLPAVTAIVPAGLVSDSVGQLRVKAGAEAGSFQIWLELNFVFTAADFLRWSDQAAPDFALIREALKRPYARMEGDYSKPFEQPVPNFVSLRLLAQILAARCQCYLLLNQPDKALQELTFMHETRHLLEASPTGQPGLLVSAMINVAIQGLYAEMIAGGLQSHRWREPQLAALQKQLAETDLAPLLVSAFECEPVGCCHQFERIERKDWNQLFDLSNIVGGSGSQPAWWRQLQKFFPRPAFLPHSEEFWPRGWVYQNLVHYLKHYEKIRAGLFDAHHLVTPGKLDRVFEGIENEMENPGLFDLLSAVAIPNYSKAMQTFALNQTKVNQAQIACALERWRLAHGNYPETLDALVPQFLEKIPQDIIGGQPLHYRRKTDRNFLLYSVGWNEKDDGGLPGTLKDVKTGDWVWPANN